MAQSPGSVDEDIVVIGSQSRSKVARNTCGFLSRVIAFKIDELLYSEYSSDFLIWIRAVGDGLAQAMIEGVREFLVLLGR